MVTSNQNFEAITVMPNKHNNIYYNWLSTYSQIILTVTKGNHIFNCDYTISRNIA